MDITPHPKKAGVYKLTCINNGKIYIGKSYNIQQRLNRHKRDAEKIKNMGLFQRAIAKHGWDSFNIEILEILEDFDKSTDGPILLEKEASYIRLYDSNNKKFGYNICEYSTDRTGHKCSDETRKKMSISRLGYRCSEETKEKMRNRVYSDETRDKMRQRKLGVPQTEEHKEKIKHSNMGKVMSEESKQKLSLSTKGKSKSKEHVEKMRQSKLGKTLSEEHKLKLRGPRGPQKNKRKSKYAYTERN